MSYTGTQVYFPGSTSPAAVRERLAARFPEATLTAAGKDIKLAFDDVKVIRLAHDASTVVPEEAQWHGRQAAPAVRTALARATQRFVIEPADPAADFDDMYNELLFVFEVMRAMPDAVGHDPFDGALYFESKPTAKQQPAKKPAKKPTKRPTKKPTKRPAKKPTKRPTKKPTKKPVKRR